MLKGYTFLSRWLEMKMARRRPETAVRGHQNHPRGGWLGDPIRNWRPPPVRSSSSSTFLSLADVERVQESAVGAGLLSLPLDSGLLGLGSEAEFVTLDLLSKDGFARRLEANITANKTVTGRPKILLIPRSRRSMGWVMHPLRLD